MPEPLSITAGSAGLISFAVQLIGGCIKGFILLSTAQNLGKHASSIVCILNIQEIQLTDWAHRAGLLEGNGTLDSRLNAKAIEMTLQQLQDLLLDTKKLKDKYGLALVPQTESEEQTKTQMQSNSLTDVEKVFTSISNKTRREILVRAKLAQDSNTFKRLWWAAVDKDKIEKLAADVHFLVRELWRFLYPLWQDDFLSSTQNILSRILSLNTKFDQLVSLTEVLKVFQQGSNRPSQLHRDLNALTAAAEIKALRVCLDDDKSAQATTQPHLRRPERQKMLKEMKPLSRNKLTKPDFFKRNDSMGLAAYDGEVVLVEEKAINPTLWSKILPRIENLSALLNAPKDKTFRSLLCEGIVVKEEEDKVSFVFQHPTPGNPVEPCSLLDLFSVKGGIEPPSLTDRVHLALCIARLVQNLHRAGWLHKSLRSQNILFFPDSDGLLSLGDPFLAGFAFARLDSPTEISEQPSENPKFDIYRHPHALGEPTTSFTADMDTYALGTVLLEISEWRALRYLVDGVDVDAETVPLSRLAKVKSFLVSGSGKGGTSKLRYRMGNIYANACFMCLEGKADESEADLDGIISFKPSLVDSAVRQLESCNV